MAWEYLQQEKMDKRYELASKLIRDTDYVVDVNSGNSRMRNYVKNYYSNDLYYDEADEKCTDVEFKDKIKNCDVLCCFGIGGHEITGEPLESETVTQTLIDIINKHRPRLIILESIQRFSKIPRHILNEVKYELKAEMKMNIDVDVPPELEYVKNRQIIIAKQYARATT